MTFTPGDPSTPSATPRRQPARHKWFDPYRTAETPALKNLATAIRIEVEEYERAEGLRKNRRRPADAASFETMVGATVANLALLALGALDDTHVAIPFRNGEGRTRYDHPAFGRQWYSFWPCLLALRQIERRRGRRYAAGDTPGEAATIAPSPSFVNRLRLAGVNIADVGRDPSDEVLVLSRARRDENGRRSGGRDRINYPETEETTALRARIERINAHLAGADLIFIDDGLEPVVDARDRRLYRHFSLLPADENPRFDLGGRLFGGFWMNLKRRRRDRIRVEGEPVVEVDYSSMFTRLAYARADVKPPAGDDMYAVPGFVEYRADMKTLTNALLFDHGDGRRYVRRDWPSDMKRDAEKEEAAIVGGKGSLLRKEGVDPVTTLAAIRQHHAPIARLFGVGEGYRIMFTESQVLLTVLERLQQEGVVGLGLHDGLLVQASKAGMAKAAMEEAVLEIAGADITVKVKQVVEDE